MPWVNVISIHKSRMSQDVTLASPMENKLVNDLKLSTRWVLIVMMEIMSRYTMVGKALLNTCQMFIDPH